MMRLEVVPRTIESSTAISRFPLIDRGSGLSFSITPASRSDWSGCMNVRLMYRLFINASRNGMPASSAYPIAAGVPESGKATTMSASTGDSFASSWPIRIRASSSSQFMRMESGRAK